MSKRANIRLPLAAALLVAMLAACSSQGGTPDDKMARFLVAPDKFRLYSCPQIAERASDVAARQNELRGLIAKAGSGSGGRLVSAIAYRPEYVGLRGEMNELRNAAAEKK